MIQITIILLIMIAFIHFYWAIGGTWAVDKALPTEIQGNKLLDPPAPLSALVGLVVLGFAFIAYKLWMGSNESYIVYSSWIIGSIFILRVIGDFNMVGVFKKIKGTPFAWYDTRLYIPLCLFIGISFYVTLNTL